MNIKKYFPLRLLALLGATLLSTLGESKMIPHKQGARESAVIEVRDNEQKHLANLLVSPAGEIKLEAVSRGSDVDRLGKALHELSQKPVLSTFEEKSMQVKGETVNVRTKVDVAKTDSRYPWAVADTLEKPFGYRCEVRN